MSKEPTKISISKLRLDRHNPRFLPMDGRSEEFIVNSFIESDAKHYLGLLRSILGKGYLWRECLLVLDNEDGTYTVIEGNRRVSILRLIHGKIKAESTKLTKKDIRLLKEKGDTVREETRKILCIVYEKSEEEEAYAELAPIHSLNDASARQAWTSLAKARYERNRTGKENIALQLLENFLEATAENASVDANYQKWQYSYPLDALKETIQRLSSYYGVSQSQLLAHYEDAVVKDVIDDFIRYIGVTSDVYRKIRELGDFTQEMCQRNMSISLPTHEECSIFKERIEKQQGRSLSAGNDTIPTVSRMPQEHASLPKYASSVIASVSKPKKRINPLSERAVIHGLKQLTLSADKYKKLDVLVKEMQTLKLAKNPNAFGLLLRSFFDIATIIYGNEHNLRGTQKRKVSGAEDWDVVDVPAMTLPLKERLNLAVQYLTQSNPNWSVSQRKKTLMEGSRVLASHDSNTLSIPSLNETVHNPNICMTVSEGDIVHIFHKILPLMRALTENPPEV